MLGPGAVIGEVAFFTEVPQLELVRSLTVCRVLVVPRPAFVALASDFPHSCTSMLEALQKNAEQVNTGHGRKQEAAIAEASSKTPATCSCASFWATEPINRCEAAC